MYSLAQQCWQAAILMPLQTREEEYSKLHCKTPPSSLDGELNFQYLNLDGETSACRPDDVRIGQRIRLLQQVDSKPGSRNRRCNAGENFFYHRAVFRELPQQ